MEIKLFYEMNIEMNKEEKDFKEFKLTHFDKLN